MQRTRFVLVAALAAVALVGAGCGGDDDEAGDTTLTETTETTTDTTTETPTEPGESELSGTVGPGFEISGPPSTVAPGSYELRVDDLSSAHNFHLTGPGVDVSTDVAAEGTETFSVELQPGTYEFVCDPHATSMNGSFEVS
jgi:Copper binding proteins, plastocyanin/azurin family